MPTTSAIPTTRKFAIDGVLFSLDVIRDGAGTRVAVIAEELRSDEPRAQLELGGKLHD